MPGRKVWAAGDILDAADIDDYLMRQAVMGFASPTARNAALGTAIGTAVPVREGMHAYVGGGTVTYFDGTDWKAI